MMRSTCASAWGGLLVLLLSALQVHSAGHVHPASAASRRLLWEPAQMDTLRKCGGGLHAAFTPGDIVRVVAPKTRLDPEGLGTLVGCMQLNVSVTAVTRAADMTSPTLLSFKGIISLPTWSKCEELSMTTVLKNAYQEDWLAVAREGTVNILSCCAGADCANTTLYSNYTVEHSPIPAAGSPEATWLSVHGFSPVTFATWQPEPGAHTDADCQAACADDVGCMSWLFEGTSQQCVLLPVAEIIDTAVTCANCTWGFRRPGYTCPQATLTIKHQGKIKAGWTPTLNASGAGWSQNGTIIPAALQGQATPNVAECNCRCAQVPGCVGYTWRGNATKHCWLHDKLTFWDNPVDDVYPDTLIGRVVSPFIYNSLGYCDVNTVAVKGLPGKIDASGIKTFTGWFSTPEDCFDHCHEDKACVGYLYDEPARTCTLLSGAGGGLKPDLRNATWAGGIRRCGDAAASVSRGNVSKGLDWVVHPNLTVATGKLVTLAYFAWYADRNACIKKCQEMPTCGGWTYTRADDGGTSNCTLATVLYANQTAHKLADWWFESAAQANLTSQWLPFDSCVARAESDCVSALRAAGTCGLVSAGEVVYIDSTWDDWKPGASNGYWGSSEGISPDVQGKTVASVSECLCLCRREPRCMAYVYLGHQRQCWLQRFISSYSSAWPGTPGAISGRVAIEGATVPKCMMLQPVRSVMVLTDEMLSQANTCNKACLDDPSCLGYTFNATTGAVSDCGFIITPPLTSVEDAWPVSRCTW